MKILDKEKKDKKSQDDSQTKKILKKILKTIKKVLMNLLIPFIIIIIAAALVVGIIEAVADAISEAVTSIGDMFTVNESDGSIEITDEQIDKIIDAIYDTGVNPESLGLLGDLDKSTEITDEVYRAALRKYIREFYEAQVTTETLNYKHLESTEDKTYGAVYVYRANADEDGELLNENRQALTYIPYEDMETYIENNDLDARNYFSINENDELVIAGTTQTKVEKGDSLENLKTETENESTVTLRTVNYKTAISKYTTQVMFLVDLLMISQNPEFVSALVDLIKDSRIEITIMDTVTTNEFTETYTYTPVKKWVEEVRISDTEVERVPRGPEKQPEEKEITKTTTISTTPNFNITYVKTWFCEQSITYNKKTDGPNTSEPNTQTLENEPEPSADEATWKEDITYTTQNTSTTEKYEESVRGDVVFNLGEAGDGRRFENGELDEQTFVGLMETKFKLPNTTRYAEAGSNLESGADMLFQLLQKDQTLQNMETIMRYALYKYTGNSYGVTELDSEEIYSISQLNQVVAGTSVGKEFTKSWENNSLRKYMNGETGYTGYYVTNYITEDNTKFVCYTDLNNTRNYGFGICHYTGGAAGGRSNNHIEKYAALGIDITAPQYNQLDVSTMDVDIVMTIFNQVYEELRAEVLDRKEKYAPNAPDLTEQQIICLTDMRYQGTINWPTFYEIYETQNIESIKSYILGRSSKNRAEARWKAYSEGIYTTPENEVLDPNKYGVEGILGVAKQVWLEVNDRFTTYGGLGAIPPGENQTQIDCSGYVSWVLYECGYTDFNWQVNSEKFYYTNWNQKYGWTEIPVGSGENAINLLQPGDIFVRYGNGTHHVQIVERIENGRLYAYDCGNAKNWLNSGGNSVDKSYFLDETGAGKIIRIQ